MKLLLVLASLATTAMAQDCAVLPRRGTFHLVNKKSNMALKVKNSSKTEDEPILQAPVDTTSPSDNWIFENAQGGYYRVKNQNSGLLLTAVDLYQGAIQKSKERDNGLQEWCFTLQSDGYYKMETRANNLLVLEVTNGSTSEGEAIRTALPGGNLSKQRFTFEETVEKVTGQCAELPSGSFHILNKKSGMAIGVEGGSTSEAASIVQASADSNNAKDNWRFQATSNNYYHLINGKSGLYLKAMDLSEGVIQASKSGDGMDEWCFILQNDDYYKVETRANHLLVLEVNRGSTDSGATVHTYLPGSNLDKQKFAFEESPEPGEGGSGGDPHFKTFSGQKYDFHGECDLVLVKNPDFNNGQGLNIHIRTTRRGFMSYIERAIIQIGEDSLELSNHQSEWLHNGVSFSGDTKLGGFDVWRFKSALSVRLNNDIKAKIDFITRRNGTPYVRLDAGGSDIFKGTLGMIGDWKSGNMVGRDGLTLIEDPIPFAREWQVRPAERIFQVSRAPQYPDQCLMPERTYQSRLGDQLMKKAAEKACASWKQDREECVFDVMVTRDITAASDLPFVG